MFACPCPTQQPNRNCSNAHNGTWEGGMWGKYQNWEEEEGGVGVGVGRKAGHKKCQRVMLGSPVQPGWEG